MTTNIITDIDGIINELNIGEEDVLFPIFEGVVNAIQSIQESGCKSGTINISVKRDHVKNTSLFKEYQRLQISEISIDDNGIGFTKDNFKSYCTAHSTKKINLGGKGVGRFTMLAVFNKISIKSITKESNDNKISFTLQRSEGLSSPIYEKTTEDPHTIVSMQNIDNKYSKAIAKYSDEDIINMILYHCLLYYLNGKAPNINYIKDNNEIINLNRQFDPNFFIKKKDEFTLCNKRFEIYHVKDLLDKKHEICLCGNNRIVKSKRLDNVLPFFSKPIEENEQSYYLKTYVISKYLDNIVKTSRNEFNFPKENKEEDNDDDTTALDFGMEIDSLCEKSILQHVSNSICELYPEETSKRKKVIHELVHDYLNTDEGLEFRHLNFPETFYYNIKENANKLQLHNSLMKYKYHISLENQKKCEKLMNKEYSNKKEYQDLLKAYVTFATQENSSSLAKYVAHRRTIIDLLSRYLEWSYNEKNYNEESTLHNLFFTMGQSNANTSYDSHNLWLLDDRLAFYRFIYSDKQIRLHEPNIGKTECQKETDIAIYDIPYGYDEEDEFGKIQSIVIFELKRPNRQLTVDEYKRQMKEQVMGIRNGRKKKDNGSNILMNDNTPIYFYYVIDANAYQNLKKEFIDYEHFKETPYNSLVHLNDTLYEEIFTYQTILINSKRRNKIFFDKLGIK